LVADLVAPYKSRGRSGVWGKRLQRPVGEKSAAACERIGCCGLWEQSCSGLWEERLQRPAGEKPAPEGGRNKWAAVVKRTDPSIADSEALN
jgi:hypothetical protein